MKGVKAGTHFWKKIAAKLGEDNWVKSNKET